MANETYQELAVSLKKSEANILKIWERRVRAELTEAREETTFALRDHLPKFLHELEESLEKPYSREVEKQLLAAARTHGQQRAKKSDFSLNQVVFEYEILRRTIFDELEVNKPLSAAQREAVLAKIAEGVARATEEFSDAKLTGEKNQKREAREAESRYRQLVDKLDHAIAWEADPESLRFRFVSDRAEELLGFPVSEWLSDPHFLFKHIHPDDAQKFREMIDVARKTGKGVRSEHRVIDKKGNEHWFQSGIDVEKDENNKPILFRGLCVDITPFNHIREEADQTLAELSAFLESSPIGAAFVDNKLRYKRINEPLAKLNGKPAREHIGKTVREVLGDKFADQIEPVLHRVFETGETVRFETATPIAHEGHKIHHLLANYYLVKSGETKIGVGATIVDLTKIKETERNLKEAQERYDLALEAGDIGVWELYFDSPNIKWSPRQFELFDIDPETSPLTFEKFKERVHPADRDAVMSEFDRSVKEKRDFNLEYRIQRQDGKVCWVEARGRTVYDERGKPLRMMGTNIDITGQKTAIQALQESEARIRIFIEAMPQMAFISDASGKAVFLNRRHYEYFGIPDGDIKKWHERESEFHDPGEIPNVVSRWQKSLRTGQSFEIEYKLKRHDGQWRWHLGRAEPMKDKDGQIIYWLGTNTDIDEQKKNQGELQKLLGDLEIERSLGEQFVAALTHDLKNPLTAIKTNAEVLRRYSDKPEAAERTRARILTSVERADRMIEDLLNLYRVRAGQSYPIVKVDSDLVQICQDLVDEFVVIYGDRFVIDGPEDLRGQFDPKAIRRAAENLVVNAVKYGAPETPIVIGLGDSKKDVCLSVTNQGEPIPEENIEKLFLPFQRLDQGNAKQGWGIGLAQVKIIAEAHGGEVEVEVESSKEETVFRIKLPKK